ncbi:ExbD/TolR family protein [Pyruvatibacter mobilis]|uniref:ExbD/TolR family protein n=1 Tax=Pyruvatibacter mobilis TaxID=1712261 RepID=UPI003C7C2195
MEPLTQPIGRHGRTRVVLSLTPLIDVVFILLVFFMLVSQFARWQVIDVTPVSAGEGTGSGKPPIVLVMETGGMIVIGGDRVETPASALDLVTARRTKGQSVLIRPVADVAVQPVVDLVETLAAGGITAVSVEAGPQP